MRTESRRRARRGRRRQGSARYPEDQLRKIEIAFPKAFWRAAKAGGAPVCGVMTALGADPAAGMKYAKIIREKAVEFVKFDFLGGYRPAVILGNSNTPGVLGYVMPLLHWAMPSKYRSIHKNDLARDGGAQSQQAFLAIAQDNPPKKDTLKILESQGDEAVLRQRRHRRALSSSSKLLSVGLKRRVVGVVWIMFCVCIVLHWCMVTLGPATYSANAESIRRVANQPRRSFSAISLCGGFPMIGRNALGSDNPLGWFSRHRRLETSNRHLRARSRNGLRDPQARLWTTTRCRRLTRDTAPGRVTLIRVITPFFKLGYL